jgi:hypothetical protein
MDAVKIMAKDLVRTRRYVKKFMLMRANIQAVSLKIQTLKSQNAMAQAMKVTKSSSSSNNCQCCGSGMFIPDPTFFHPGSRNVVFPSRIHIKEFKYLNPNSQLGNMIRVVHPGSGSRMRIPDPGVKKALDPGSGSETLLIAVATHGRILGSLFNR